MKKKTAQLSLVKGILTVTSIFIFGAFSSYEVLKVASFKREQKQDILPKEIITFTPTTTAIPTQTPTMAPSSVQMKISIKSTATPSAYPNLDDKALFTLLNKKRVENGVGELKHDKGTCQFVDGMLEFYVSNGRLPYVPEVDVIKKNYYIFLHPQFGMGDAFKTVDQAINALSTASESKWLFTSGEFSVGCIKSQKGAVVMAVAFN